MSCRPYFPSNSPFGLYLCQPNPAASLQIWKRRIPGHCSYSTATIMNEKTEPAKEVNSHPRKRYKSHQILIDSSGKK